MEWGKGNIVQSYTIRLSLSLFGSIESGLNGLQGPNSAEPRRLNLCLSSLYLVSPSVPFTRPCFPCVETTLSHDPTSHFLQTGLLRLLKSNRRANTNIGLSVEFTAVFE
jgi:hypothetical protein